MNEAFDEARRNGRGPDIWLAGDPADLGEWLERGAAGIVTNTVVQRELAAKYGGLLEVTRRYRKYSVYRCGSSGHNRNGVLRNEVWEDSGEVRMGARRHAGAR